MGQGVSAFGICIRGTGSGITHPERRGDVVCVQAARNTL